MRARAWKRSGLILGILALVLSLAVLVAPMLVDLNRYHDFIVSEIQSAVGGKVEVGRISWGVTHRIWMEIDGLAIVNASAFPGDVKITRIHSGVSIPQLLFKKLVLQDLRLEISEARFRLEPTAEDTAPPAGETQSTDAPLPIGIAIQRLVVAIDRLEVDDALSVPGRRQTHVFSDVALTVNDLAPERLMTFDVSLQDTSPEGLGSLKARGTFSGLSESFTLDSPVLKVQANLATLHVDVIKPYLAGIPPRSQIAGTISATLDYEGDLGQLMQVQGTIDLGRLSYSDPELWDDALPGRATTITYQLNLEPHKLTAERINVKLGKLSLNARGVLQGWNKEPVIKVAELSLNLPLGDLAHLIPWRRVGKSADMLRATLERGGQIALSKVMLPELNLEELPSNVTELFPEIEMTVDVTGVFVQPAADMPEIENIEGTAQLANGIVQVRGLKGRIASVDVPPISGTVTSLLEEAKIDANINGRLTLGAIADEKFQELLDNIGLEKVVGAADLDLTIGLDMARPEDFQLEGNIGLKDFLIKTTYTPALFSGLNADMSIDPHLINVSRASATVALSPGATSPGDHFTLDIQAQVNDWRGEPSATLQSFKTSSIPLPLLASMVPWKKLDQSAVRFKEILHAGGDISIDTLSFPMVEFSDLSKDPKHLIPRMTLATTLIGLTVPRGLSPTRIEGITGQVNLEKNVLVAENLKYRIGPFALPVLDIRATDVAGDFKVSLRAKGPLEVATEGDREVEDLLVKHGLKRLSVSALVDLRAEFDRRKPEAWTVKGALVLHDAHAEALPAAVTVDDVKGQVTFSRAKTVNVSVKNVSARINQAPVRLSGHVSDIGSPRMQVTGKAYTRGLDLSHLKELLAGLKDMKLAGVLDMDVDVHVPFSTPAESRLKGTLTARDGGFRLASSNLEIAKADLNMKLTDNTANIETSSLQVNDQKVTFSGYMANPPEPRIELSITSPDLNLDRLLFRKKVTQSSPTKEPTTDQKAGKTELPSIARKLTADLHLKAKRGQYKGLQLDNLKLDVSYENGEIESYDLSTEVGEGHISTKGSADLRDLDRIGFSADPDISALSLKTVSPVLGIDKLPLDGPLTLQGRLRGHTGGTKDVLRSLDGALDASLGPGNLSRVGKAGGLVAKLLSVTSISGLFSGRLFSDFSKQGIPFEAITAKSTFDKGTLNLSDFRVDSDAMTLEGGGKIDLIKEALNVDLRLMPLATADETLDFVPIVGKALEDVTEVHIEIVGPLDDPKIRTAEVKDFGKAIGSEITKPGKMLEDVGEGLKNMF